MGFKIEAGVLARVMGVAGQAVDRRNTLPILDNVCLILANREIEIVTTNLDIEYRETVPVEAAKNAKMALTVQSGRLAAIAAALPAQATIAFEAGEDASTDRRVVVKSGRSRWQLPTLPVDDFPRLQVPADLAAQVEIDSETLAAILKRVLPWVSDEEVRYYLHGPLWHSEADAVALAATNGQGMVRVVAHDVPWPDGAPDVIVPPNLARIAEMLGKDKEPITIAWSERMIRFERGAVTVTGKAIDGTFPDYRRIIPGEAAEPVRVDPAGIETAIKHVRIAADKRGESVKLARGKDAVTLAMAGDDSCAASEEVAAETEAGGETHFNSSYLLEMMRCVGGDSVEMHQADAGAPALFRRTVKDGCLAVLMPMRG